MEEPVPMAVERSSESVIDNMADHKRKHAMQLFRDAVFEKLTRSRSCNLTPAVRSLLERRLLQLIPDFHIPSHPTYALMILRAIRELDGEGGSSEEAISSFIKTEYHDLPLGHKSLLSRHLSMMCNRGEICVDEERRFKIPNLSTNGTEELSGWLKKGFSQRRCRSKRKGMRRREREVVLSGEENQLKRQRHILTEEQGFTRVVQFSGEVTDVGSKLQECSVKVGASHNEADLQQMETSGDRDMITEENCEGTRHDKLQEFSVEEVSGALNPVEVQETELVENQDMVTEEQSDVVKEITQESDGGNCCSITPELRTCSDLAHSLDQNVQSGHKEPIGLQIQSEFHQNQSVVGKNQPQEQLDVITEHNHYGSCPEEAEVKVLNELNESMELENDIVEKSLPLEQAHMHRQRKRKYHQSEGKSLEAQRRSKRLQMLIEEHESVSDGPSVELDKGQQGDIGVGRDENLQGLQVESMEAKIHEKEQSNVSEEGGEDDANGEQKQSDKLNSEVANEQTHMPQHERLEVIKVQDQTGCGGAQLGKQNMVEEESPSHNKLMKEFESWLKETAVVEFCRRSKRPENMVKKPLSGGILSQSEKNQHGEMGKGRGQTQGTRSQDDTRVEEFAGQDQLKRYGNNHSGEKRVEVTKEATMIPAVTTNKKVNHKHAEGQSMSRESRPCKDNLAEGSGSFQLLKGGKLQKNRRIPVVVHALRQSPRLQDKEKGEKPEGECYKPPKGKRPQKRVQSIKKDDVGKAGKPVMSASKAQPELERQNQETPEQVGVGVEENREEMQMEVSNEQFEEQEREGGGSGNIELECEIKLTQDKNEAKDGTDDTSLRKEKRHQNNSRRPIVVLALRHSPRLQDKEKGERSDGQCCKLIEERSLLEFLQKGNKGNKRQPGKPVKSPIQPKGQRYLGEQTVPQEQQTGVSVEQSKQEKQMKGHEEEELEEQEKEANELQNSRKGCEVKEVTADKNEATFGKEDILKVSLDADDVCYNPRHFEHDFKIYRRHSIRRRECGGLIFRS